MKTQSRWNRSSAGTPRGGVNLIDLTLTLFIIGLFAAIALPRYGQVVTRIQADAIAERIVADLHLARHQAKLKCVPQTVQFDAETEHYELIGMNDLDNPESPYLVDLTEGGPAIDLVSASFGASGTDPSVVFDIYGRPNAGGSVVISAGGNVRTLLVKDHTGEVEIQP